jgi:hypothetical protein
MKGKKSKFSISAKLTNKKIVKPSAVSFTINMEGRKRK